MSGEVGRYAFMVAGGVVGAFFGVPALGFAIGGLIGGAVFPVTLPDVKQEGPKLADLQVQSSTYSRPLPRVYGISRLAGNLIWSEPRKQTTHTETQTVGGKGGAPEQDITQTTYTYSISCALSLCDGVISGVRRIWMNKKLVYDIGATADYQTYVQSQGLFAGMRVYLGTETQLADPLIEASEGATWTGYRGTAYVVFDNLQLATFSNALPLIEFEVIKSGTIAPQMAPLDSVERFERAVNGSITPDGLLLVANGNAFGSTVEAQIELVNPYTLAPIRVFDPRPFIGFGASVRGSHPAMNGRGDILFYAESGGPGLFFWPAGGTPVAKGSGVILARIQVDEAGIFYATTRLNPVGVATNYLVKILPENGNMTLLYGWTVGSAMDIFDTRDGYLWVSIDPVAIEKHNRATGELVARYTTGPAAHGVFSLAVAGDGSVWYVASSGIYRIEPDLSSETLIYPASSFSQDGQTRINRDWSNGDILWASNNAYKRFHEDGTLVLALTGRGVVIVTSPIAPALIYQMDVRASGGPHVTAERLQTFTVTSYGLDDLVLAECALAGYAAAEIDVTELAADIVRGYTINTHTPASQGLQPILGAYQINVVESNGKLAFRHRGGGTTLTLFEDEDLSARLESEDLRQEPVIVRAQEPELPRLISVNYLDSDTDYQVGAQEARRLVVRSDNDINVSLPLVLSGTEARRVAESMLYEQWAARTRYSFSTWNKAAKVEPGDPITIVMRDGSELPMVPQRIEGGQGMLRVEAVGYEPSAYTQTTLGGALPESRATVAVRGPTNLQILDTALLRDADDNYGAYLAAAGYLSDWPGGKVLKSSDGSTFADTGIAFDLPATMGFATTRLGDFAGGNVVDWSNSVDVSVTEGTLTSVTDFALFNGANAAYLGGEIVQFRVATLIATSVYRLQGLLRGRLGTYWALRRHGVGEPFVVLDRQRLRKLDTPAADTGVLRYYKGVTFLTNADGAAAIPMIVRSNRLKPLAPTHVGGGRNAALDVIIKWVRQARVNPGWKNDITVLLDEPTESYEIDVFAGTTKTITAVNHAIDATITSTAHGYLVGNEIHITGVAGMTALNDRAYTITAVIDADHYTVGENTSGYPDYISGGTTRKRGRTLTATTPTVTYTVAQQTTDYAGAQATVYVVPYQMSSRVGRGYAGHGVIGDGAAPGGFAEGFNEGFA